MPAAFYLQTCNSHASLSQAVMSKGSSSSHGPWQGAARWKKGLNDASKGRSPSLMSESQMPYTGCRTKYSRLWSPLRGGHRRRTPSKPHQGRKNIPPTKPWKQPLRRASGKEDAKRLFEQICQEVADAETVYHEATKSTLEKTEALEKRVKTVTMRAESLATAEADFFQTHLERQEETQRNLNELSTQLLQTRSTQ